MSLELAIDGELSVKESFLLIAQAICEQELSLDRMPFDQKIMTSWQSGRHFPAPMSLHTVNYLRRQTGSGIEVVDAIFELPDEEIRIAIDAHSDDLNDDIFANDILDRFKLYPQHEHELCFQALAQQLSA